MGLSSAARGATRPIQKENAETLLRKLIELNDPKYTAVGFILAVMLERKRLLKVKEQILRDGQRIFIYEHPKTGDLFTILDPNLQLTQLEEVQHDVAHLLEHGFNGGPEAVPAALAAIVENEAPAVARVELLSDERTFARAESRRTPATARLSLS